jgi:hypothetical protein
MTSIEKVDCPFNLLLIAQWGVRWVQGCQVIKLIENLDN